MSDIPVYHLDANVLLRFILSDHDTLSPKALRLIKQANQGNAVLCLSAIAVAEVFYVMKSVYRVERRKAAAILAELLNAPGFRLAEQARIMDTLARVRSANVDFGDAYLAASAAETDSHVVSFDRDLDKFADVKRYEP